MTVRSRRLLTTLAATVVLLAGCDRFTSVDSRLARAASNLEAGEFQAALIDLRKSLDAESDNIDAQLLMVDVLKAWGDIAGARLLLDGAVAAGAPAAATEARALDLLLLQGDPEAVRNTLAVSTTLSPAQRDTFEGQLAMLENRPAEAQALVRHPRHRSGPRHHRRCRRAGSDRIPGRTGRDR